LSALPAPAFDHVTFTGNDRGELSAMSAFDGLMVLLAGCAWAAFCPPRRRLARHASVGTHPSGKTPGDKAGADWAPTQQHHLSFQLFLCLWRSLVPRHAFRQQDVEQVEHPICGDALDTIAPDVALDGLKDRAPGMFGHGVVFSAGAKLFRKSHIRVSFGLMIE
jgi:hypothetical protein